MTRRKPNSRPAGAVANPVLDVVLDAAHHGAAGHVDLLDVGSHRRTAPWVGRLSAGLNGVPRSLRYGAAAIAIGVGFAVIVVEPNADRAHVGTQSATVQTLLPGDRELTLVQIAAQTPGSLADYVRSDSPRGACPIVPVGHSVQAAITASLRRVMPAYGVRDSAMTLDEFTGLCSVALRAADADGSILVIEVAAPTQPNAYPFTKITLGSRQPDAGRTLRMATAVTRAGWSVTVGALAPTSDVPSSGALLSVAQDPSVLW